MSGRVATVVAVGALGGVLAVLLVKRSAGKGLKAWLSRVGHRTALAAFLAAVLSATFYSVVHEFGHVLFAVALGGKVRSVTWTIFSSVEPHVSYNYLPLGADLWARAGGHLLPTGVALVLMAAWFVFIRGRRVAGLGVGLLLVPAATLLLCNLGCVPELFQQRSHLRSLAAHYGLGKTGEVILASCLAAVSIALIWIVVGAARNTWRASPEIHIQSAAPNGGPATRLGNSGVRKGPPSVR